MSLNLEEKLDGIIDGYYEGSYDHKLIVAILEEVEFLYGRGILQEKGLGRFVDILERDYSE